MTSNDISYLTIGKAIEIHRTLGVGLLESAYEECLYYELTQAGLWVEKQKSLPLIYKEIKLEHGYRADLIIDEKVVIEIKCVEFLLPVHTAQILTYMKLGNYPLGLLINFYSKILKNGINRYVI